MYKFFLFVFLVFSIGVFAQDKPKGKFNGVLFGDYFYKIEGDSSGSSNQYSSYSSKTTGVTVRRARLHYEHSFNENFAGNFGIELNDVTKIDNKVSFMVYDAQFEWKNLVPNSSIYFGLMPAPTFVWGMSENMYGYRSLEKTIADKNRIGTALEIGAMMKGKFDKEGKYGYTVMLGNGKGSSAEVSKFPKFYSSLYVKFLDDFVAEAYFDYQNNYSEQYRITAKSVLAYKNKDYTFVFEPFFQNRNNAVKLSAPQNPIGFSLSAKVNLLKRDNVEKTEALNIFARYDYFDPDSNNGTLGFKENFFIAGLDFLPFSSFHIMPNIWLNTYKDKSSSNISRPNDIVGRVTFWYQY